MPIDLPGFYFDEAKNRYFPLSSKPKKPENSIVKNLDQHLENQLSSLRHDNRQPWSIWHVNMKKASSSPHFRTRRDSHEILCSQYASSSRLVTSAVPTFGVIQAFRSIRFNNTVWRFIGDDQGWLYNDRAVSLGLHGDSNFWSADLNLQPASPISSISASGSHCVSTCLGPGKISVQDLETPERLFLLNINGVFDIWASHLHGPTLTLGASRRAVYIPDVDISTSPEFLHTSGDVLSIYREQTLVYAGTRNGTVERFDIRMPKHRSEELFNDRFGANARSSVLYLDIGRGHELLLSHLDGTLVTYDLRFSSSLSSPIKVYPGHVNTHTRNLGIAVDYDLDVLFAAGQDCRIRGWSLRTGAPIQPPEPTTNNPFSITFSEPIGTLQVTHEVDEAGTSLWAASSRNLHQFYLGQKSLKQQLDG